MVLMVDNCWETYQMLRERGAHFEQPPEERPYRLEALAKDLDGNTLDLLEPFR